MSFVEINAFRRLVHLKLRLNCGSDAQIRRHLSQQLLTLKSGYKEVMALYQTSKEDLTEMAASQARLRDEVGQLKATGVDREAVFANKLEVELQREREKSALDVNQVKASFQSERKRLVDEHSGVLRRLQNQVGRSTIWELCMLCVARVFF